MDRLEERTALIYIGGDWISQEFEMKVAKWGNSLAVRLPAEVVDALGLKEGDDIDLRSDLQNTVSLQVAKRLTQVELIESLRKFRGMRPVDYKFNRDEANER